MEKEDPNDYYKLFKGLEWKDIFGQVEQMHFLLELKAGSTDHLSPRDRDDIHGFVIRHALSRMTSALHKGFIAYWDDVEPRLAFLFQRRG